MVYYEPKKLIVPQGFFNTVEDDDEAKKKRKEIREKLLRGEEVKVTPEGNVKQSTKSHYVVLAKTI